MCSTFYKVLIVKTSFSAVHHEVNPFIYPGFDGSPGGTVEQLAALPVECGIFFPELGGGVGDAAAAGGGEGDDGLA